MAAVLWNLSGTRQTDDDNAPLPGAQAFFFDAGTTTPRTVYTDGDLSIPHPTPVVADAYGRWPAVYLSPGAFRFRLLDADDVTLLDFDDILTNEEISVDPETVPAEERLQTGMMVAMYRDGTLTGFVRANGRTIGSAASGADERANDDCEDLFTQLWTADDGLDLLTVSTGKGMSAAGDWAANKTITLPDLRNRAPVGVGDMGNSNAARIVDARVINGTNDDIGANGGLSEITQTIDEMPVHDHPAASPFSRYYYRPVTGGSFFTIGAGTQQVNDSGTIAPQGGGQPHNNMPPFLLLTFYIKL